MAGARDRLVEVLKAELEFVEKGGYRNTARAAWRPHFIFQDSPTCLNFNPLDQPRDCSGCVLMALIPAERREDKIPCRHIPLNDQGETIDSLYRYGSYQELEAAFTTWLRVTIGKLQLEKVAPRSACAGDQCCARCGNGHC
jgi:hypothetical protein